MKIQSAGIVGCGNISSAHGGFLAGWDGAELRAVCDIDPERLEQATKKFGCRGYLDFQTMLTQEDMDIVHICTPHYLHASMAVEAMRSGRHVFCEKPMATTTEDALKMIHASEETGKKLGICFQNRYNPESLRMKEMVDSGCYGKIEGIRAFVTWNREALYYQESNWRGTWEREGGGVLINQAIHTLDLVQWLAGKPERLRADVFTSTLSGVIEVEDSAAIYFESANGSKNIIYATNSFVMDSPIILEMVMEQATARIEEGLRVLDRSGEVLETYAREEDPQRQGIKYYWGNSHGRIIQDFYRCIEEEIPFPVDGKAGMEALRIVEASYRSSRARDFIRPGKEV
ncbi:MAG TPA: gfo/Idh/MocA family oxidoreductase [Clostridiales bacterium]|nr:gfo/Idh/MocA family oxidoreductase [Clostridiales bacterium]